MTLDPSSQPGRLESPASRPPHSAPVIAAGAAPPEPAEWRSRGTAAGRPGRIVIVDAARGAALAGMVAYHLAWDLRAFGLTATDPGRTFGWHWLGQGVAGLFLGLTGVSLVLARMRGGTRRDAARRLLVIAAAAALVTLATFVATPGSVITFGILHCIVVTNLVALGLDRSPSPLLLVAAGVAIGVPMLIRLPGAPPWTGLAAMEPTTLDFRPILPWLGPVLIGMVVGRMPGLVRPAAWPRMLRLRGALAWAGRHSLAIYLVHQPVLIAFLVAFAHEGSPQDDIRALRSAPEAAAFLKSCAASCQGKGGDPAVCTATCHCVLTGAVAHADDDKRHALSRWIAPPTPVRNAIAACQATAAGSG